MIVLSKAIIAKLEKIIQTGYVVELSPGAEGSLQISRRPCILDEIPISPTLLCGDERVVLKVYKTGEDAIALGEALIPPGHWVCALKVARLPESEEQQNAEV